MRVSQANSEAHRKDFLMLFLYKRGQVEPVATFGGQDFQDCIWKKKVHPNPTFSRDGKRIYFNHPVSEDRTVGCFVEVDELLNQH